MKHHGSDWAATANQRESGSRKVTVLKLCVVKQQSPEEKKGHGENLLHYFYILFIFDSLSQEPAQVKKKKVKSKTE